MFLDRITIDGLAKMLEPHMRRPAWPGLDDAGVRRKARSHAKRLGLWDRLTREVDPSRPIPVIKRSDYREYSRTGSRTEGEAAIFERARRTSDAALAVWLGHPAADLDHLQDLLWSWCETTSWIWPAHEGRTIDLGSSRIGRMLSEIAWMFDAELEGEVKERVRAEVERRILDGACDWRRPDSWQTVEMNWNHVCNANVITTALYMIDDPTVLAAYIHPLIQRLEYAIHGFADDGGCLEGPGYWEYGFGHFLDAGLVLHNRTGGKLDIVTGGKIERICRYPVAAHIEGSFRSTFADSSHGWLRLESAVKVNRFFDIPELYALVERTKAGRPVVSHTRGESCLWRVLAICEGRIPEVRADTRDCLLADLGQVKLRAGKGKLRATLMAKAGRNDVPHNHNDIGSFIYFAKGTPMLVDPGAPKYTSKTFGPRRYEILFTRSRGHSVPVVNGREQSEGSRRFGTLDVEGLNGEGEKRAVVDMTHAYDDKTLTKLMRELTLRPDGSLVIADSYEFTRKPASLEEAFVTYEKARTVKGGRAVLIGERERSVTLSAKETPGEFETERLVEESKEGRTDKVLTRITFAPASLEKSMRLVFDVR